MNGILLCVILFVSLPLHVEDISLLHLTSPESQDNDKQDEGLSKQDALPDNPGQQVDAIPPAGGEEDAARAVPEMDPASNIPQVMSFNLSSAEIKDSEQVESPPKPEQLKQIEHPGTLDHDQSDGSAPGSDDLEREKRSPKFDPLPNGDSCLLSGSSGDVYYEYIDATGLECQCELCFPGHIVARNCTCDRSTLDIPQRTECRLVEQGKQFMPVHNKCTTGIDCKACPYPWIVKIECPPTSDTECECGSEGYSVDGNDCIPLPRCGVDHEPRFGDGEQHNVKVCQRCKEGYSQPKSNSTDKCLKIPDPTMLRTQTPTVPDEDSPALQKTTSPKSIPQPVTIGPTPLQTHIPVPNSTPAFDNTPTRDVTPTPGPTQKRCFSVLELILSNVVSLLIGGGVLYVLTKKPCRCLHQRCTKAEDSKSSSELEEIVADNGANRTRDEANTNEPSASSPLTSDSNIGKNAHKRPGGKRARKRGGKHNSL